MLPPGSPKLEDYPNMTNGYLDYEITFCIIMMQKIKDGAYFNPGDLAKLYQERLERAETELERRYLLS